MKNNRNDNYMETRVSLLEQSIKHINEILIRIDKRLDTLDSDIKSNFRYTITTMIGLFVLQGFVPLLTHWISKFIT